MRSKRSRPISVLSDRLNPRWQAGSTFALARGGDRIRALGRKGVGIVKVRHAVIRRANHLVKPPTRKYSYLPKFGFAVYVDHLGPRKGRFAIVTTRGPGCGGRGRRRREGGRRAGQTVSGRVARTTGAFRVRPNRVVLAPEAGVKPCGGAANRPVPLCQQSARRRWQQSSSHRGDRDISRSNHCAGKAGCFRPTCGSPAVSVHPRICTAGHGCQPAPGLPCALFLGRGGGVKQGSGRTCRENAKLCPRCEMRIDSATPARPLRHCNDEIVDAQFFPNVVLDKRAKRARSRTHNHRPMLVCSIAATATAPHPPVVMGPLAFATTTPEFVALRPVRVEAVPQPGAAVMPASRSIQLTIFWRCSCGHFSSRNAARASRQRTFNGFDRGFVGSKGSGNADSRPKRWDFGGGGLGRRHRRDSGRAPAHPPPWRAPS